jgi:hypothetical protein
MAALGFGWADVTVTQVYTIFDIHPLLADEFVRRGAIPGGLTWHFARPPVQGLDFEVRGEWRRSRRPKDTEPCGASWKGSSQSGTTSSNPPPSSGESANHRSATVLVAEDYSRSGDLPKARKPADGQLSGTEPGPLADPQGTTKHPRDVVKFNDLEGEFVVR